MTADSSPTVQLTIIGCGTLGSAIVDGIRDQEIASRTYRLRLTARSEESVKVLRRKYPEATVSSNNNDEAVWEGAPTATAHLIIIGTQTQFTKTVCLEIHNAIRFRCNPRATVILTVCPGITTEQLQAWLPEKTPIIRSMPNTPCSVGQGATGIFLNELVTSEMMVEVKLVLSIVSPCVEVLSSEELLDVVASVSGSGPAYLFYVAQAMVEAAIVKGLPEKQAKRLVIQSFIGAGLLAQRMPDSLVKLLRDVCVPGGSTEKAMATLDCHSVSGAILEAVIVSWQANVGMGKV